MWKGTLSRRSYHIMKCTASRRRLTWPCEVRAVKQLERQRKVTSIVLMMLQPGCARPRARAHHVRQHHQHNWGFFCDPPWKLARFQAIPKTPQEPSLSASGLLLMRFCLGPPIPSKMSAFLMPSHRTLASVQPHWTTTARPDFQAGCLKSLSSYRV